MNEEMIKKMIKNMICGIALGGIVWLLGSIAATDPRWLLAVITEGTIAATMRFGFLGSLIKEVTEYR